MSPATGRKKAEAPKKLTIGEVFKTAQNYEDAQKAEAAAAKIKKGAQNALTSDLLRRKVRSMESDKFGPFTRVTVIQNETPQYDDEGLYNELTVPQRRLCFDRFVNLNDLDADARKRVIAALTKEELAKVTTYSLNIEKLSEAVQARKIKAKLVARFTTFVKSAPYIRISHGKDS
jgi:hypothetical protein